MAKSMNETWSPTKSLPWGKHKGIQLKDVPVEYLEWLHNQPWIRDWPGLYNYLRSNQELIARKMKEAELDRMNRPSLKEMETYDDYLNDYQGF